nr:DUF2283 domain-containing protein [uncultured Rhodopila sp.]
MVAVAEPTAAALTADFDRTLDVLYVTFGPPRPGYGEDGPDDVILRFGEHDDKPSGVTVVGFRANGWLTKTQDLALIIAQHVGVSQPVALQVIEQAAA